MGQGEEQTAGAGTGTITWADFTRVVLCAGTVVRVEPFPEARKPAWKLWVDFGPHGTRRTSAQIRDLYDASDLLGRQVVGVVNFPPKQIGPFMSEFLLTGFPTDAGVVLTTLERPVPDGTRMA
ncbi:MAG: tRNA-binding protein [Lysobacteraceae bacterium]|mgnify:CR=1 FL=1